MTSVFCKTCGSYLFDDEDPYADPDCIHCLMVDIMAEVDAEAGVDEAEWLDEQAELRALADSWGCLE